MTRSKAGAKKKRGTEKVHTTQRLEVGDKDLIKAKADAACISPPDFIHALCETIRVPGSDAEKMAALSASAVFFQNEASVLARELHRTRLALQGAQEKNFYIAQRARAMQGAFTSLPASVLSKLPERFLSKNKAIIQAHSIPEGERVVVV